MFVPRGAALLIPLTASLALAGPGTADARPEYADGDGNSGSALVAINPAFGDSLLEIDRTLNANQGGGSAGSDNEGGE